MNFCDNKGTFIQGPLLVVAEIVADRMALAEECIAYSKALGEGARLTFHEFQLTREDAQVTA